MSINKVNFASGEWFSGIADHCNFITGADGFVDVGVGIKDSEAWILADKGFNPARIIGFEPHPERYAKLKDSYPGELHNLAVSSQVCKISGHICEDFIAENQVNSQKDIEAYQSAEITAVSVDSVIKKHGYQNAIVWADVEGSEYEVVLGSLRSLMHKKIGCMFLELSNNYSTYEIVNLMARLGYYPVACSGLSTYKKYPCGSHALHMLQLKNKEHADVAFMRNNSIELKDFEFGIITLQ